jgi:hypothetical protein
MKSRLFSSKMLDLKRVPMIAPVGCVICLPNANAREILVALPAGLRKEINVRGIPFCFWKPDREGSAHNKEASGAGNLLKQ